MFAPGKIIAGHYRLIRLLGGGGMGVVWYARNEAISRDVAIKVMHPQVAEDPLALKRFFNEAQICGSIRNPGIVDVLDLGCAEDGSPFIVMELLEGESLESRLERERRLPPSVILPIVRDIARTIALAHQKSVIHRDLKPANVFLPNDAPGQSLIKVLDFGISKVVSPDNAFKTTRTGAIIGSPAYMSPEHALGRPVDQRTDVYALGVILFEALSGRTPFDGDNYNALIVAIATMDPPDIAALVPGLPEEIASLVRAAMAKSVDQRIASMIEFAERVEKIIPFAKEADLRIQAAVDEPTQIPGMRAPLLSSGEHRAVSQTASMAATMVMERPKKAPWPLVGGAIFAVALGTTLLLLLRTPAAADQPGKMPATSPPPSVVTAAEIATPPPGGATVVPASASASAPSVVPAAPDSATAAPSSSASATPVKPGGAKPGSSGGGRKKTPGGAWSYD